MVSSFLISKLSDESVWGDRDDVDGDDNEWDRTKWGGLDGFVDDDDDDDTINIWSFKKLFESHDPMLFNRYWSKDGTWSITRSNTSRQSCKSSRVSDLISLLLE